LTPCFYTLIGKGVLSINFESIDTASIKIGNFVYF